MVASSDDSFKISIFPAQSPHLTATSSYYSLGVGILVIHSNRDLVSVVSHSQWDILLQLGMTFDLLESL